MESRSAQIRQAELATIVHEGREFTQLGSSVNGRYVSGYTSRKSKYGNISLQRWSGQIMVECRSEIVREHYHEWHSPVSIVFQLTRGRFICGYALEADGALFRGELITNATMDDARREALSQADYWLNRDAEDDEQFQAEMDAEDEG